MRLQLRPRLISDLRLSRLAAWARLWLAWAGIFVAGAFGRAREMRAHVGAVRRMFGALLVLNAASYAPARPSQKGRFQRWRLTRASLLRASLGARVRKQMRGSRLGTDLEAQIAALSALVAAPEAAIAAVAVRLLAGLTRMRIAPRAPVDAAYWPPKPANAAVWADTS